MQAQQCSIITPLDKALAGILKNMYEVEHITPALVTHFRDKYNTIHGNEEGFVEFESLKFEDKIKIMTQLIQDCKKKHKEELDIIFRRDGKIEGNELSKRLRQFQDTWKGKQAEYRQNMVYNDIVRLINQWIESKNDIKMPDLTIRKVLKGFVFKYADGTTKKGGGLFNLLEDCYYDYVDRYQKSRTLYQELSSEAAKLKEAGELVSDKLKSDIEKYKYERDEYKKVLENWPALCTIVKVRMAQNFGLQIGLKSEYVAEELDLSELEEEDVEEKTKDSTNDKNEQINPYKSMDLELKIMLSYIERRGEDAYDDLGNPQYYDPKKITRFLKKQFIGVQNIEEMMQRLKNLAEGKDKKGKDTGVKYDWVNDIIDMLLEDSQLQVAFFSNFRSTFQYYAQTYETVNKYGVVQNFRRMMLNHTGNAKSYIIQYLNALVYGNRKTFDVETLLFHENGDIDKEQWKKMMTVLAGCFRRKKVKILGQYIPQYGKNSLKLYDTESRNNVLNSVLEEPLSVSSTEVDAMVYVLGKNGFGIYKDADLQNALNQIRESDMKEFAKIVNLLAQLEDTLSSSFYKDDTIKLPEIRERNAHLYRSVTDRLFSFHLSTTSDKRIDTPYKIKHIGEIISMLYPYIKDTAVDTSVMYKSKKKRNSKMARLYSVIQPSLLSDLLDRFTEAGNKANEFIKDLYLKNPFYGEMKLKLGTEQPVILNRWLRDIWNDLKGDGIRGMLRISRDLGTDTALFEDIGTQKHLEMLLANFYDEQRLQYAGGILYFRKEEELKIYQKRLKELEQLKESELFDYFKNLYIHDSYSEDTGLTRIFEDEEGDRMGNDDFTYMRLYLSKLLRRKAMKGAYLGGTQNAEVDFLLRRLTLTDGYRPPESDVKVSTLGMDNSQARLLIVGEGTDRKVYTNKDDKFYETAFPKAWYPTFILGDSGKQLSIEAPIYAINEIIDEYLNVWEQELIRMTDTENMNLRLSAEGKDLVANYSEKGTVMSYMGEMKEELRRMGVIRSNASIQQLQEVDKSSLKKAVAKVLNRQFNTFMKQCSDMGMFETEQAKTSKFKTALDGKKKHNGYTHLPDCIYNCNERSLDFNRIMLREQLRPFFYNYKFAMLQQIQLTMVDPVFLKNTKNLQKRNKGIQTSGISLCTEAVDPSTGEQFNPYLNVVYVDDIEIDTEQTDKDMFEVLKNVFGSDKKAEGYLAKYKESSLTDGQTFCSLDSYRRICIMADHNKWTGQQENLYQKILRIRKINKELKEDAENKKQNKPGTLTIKEIKERKQEIEALKIEIYKTPVAFPAIKSFYEGFEEYKPKEKTIEYENGDTVTDKNGNPVGAAWKSGILLPVQLKHSECVIIPELMEDCALKTMGEWMQDNSVDAVSASTVVKVGCYGQAHIKDCKDAASLNTALSNASVHSLHLKNYRITTNIPVHNDIYRLLGSQIRKLVLEGIKKGKSYAHYFSPNFTLKLRRSVNGEENILKGKNITGKSIIQLYNSCIVANYLDSFEEFAKSFTSLENVVNLLSQASALSEDACVEKLISYAATKDERFLIPLSEATHAFETCAQILSLYRKFVNKQPMQGGSFVQASAYGLTGYSEDGGLHYITDDAHTNILYAECEVPWALSYTTADGTQVPLPFERYCNADGTLKLSTKETTDPMFKSYKGKDGKCYIPLIELDYPDILSIVAYRVPTEQLYSTMMLRIKRFSPPAISVIKVPAQGTAQAGFDFDIDKLYFLRKEFKAKRGFKIPIKDIWGKYDPEKHKFVSGIYHDYPDIYTALVNARLEEEGLPAQKGNTMADLFVKEFAKLQELYKDTESVENSEPAKKLYSYWKAAGLDVKYGMSYTEFFNSYVASHITQCCNMEEWEQDKFPEENSRTARNNMILHIITKRLQDPETIKQRLTPGGFAEASSVALYIRKLIFGNVTDENINDISDESKEDDPEPNYDPTDPITLIRYNVMNQIAAKLIGMFANQNSSHVFSSMLDTLELEEPIAFGDHPEGLKDFLHHGESQEEINRRDEILIRVAELLSASVDAVKDPVLNYLNLNVYTASVGGMLIRLGYSMKEVGLFLNQPIIKEVCQYAQNNETHISTAIAAICEKHYGNSKILDNTQISQSNVNTKKLEAILAVSKGDPKWINKYDHTQIQVLKLFSEAQKSAQELSLFIQCTKYTASSSIGTTMGDIYEQNLKVKNAVSSFKRLNIITSDSYKNSPVSANVRIPTVEGKNGKRHMDKRSYIESLLDNPFAFEQVNFNLLQHLINIIRNYFPYETKLYKDLRDAANDMFIKTYIKAEQIEMLHQEFPQYLLQQRGISQKPEENLLIGDAVCRYTEESYKNKNEEELLYTNRQYYTEKFPIILADLITKEMREKYPILEQLLIMNKSLGSYTISNRSLVGLSSPERDTIIQSWKDLYEDFKNNENPHLRNLAQDLWLTFYYSKGFTYDTKTLLYYTPIAIKESLPGYLSLYNTLTEDRFSTSVFGGNQALIQDYLKQWVLNHAVDAKGKWAYSGLIASNIFKIGYNEKPPVYKKINAAYLTEAKAKEFYVREGPKEDPTYTFKPLIQVGEYWYRVNSHINENGETVLANADLPFFKSKSPQIVYELVNLQGEHRTRASYFSSNENAQDLRFLSTEAMQGTEDESTDPPGSDEGVVTNESSDVEEEKPQGTIYTVSEALAEYEGILKDALDLNLISTQERIKEFMTSREKNRKGTLTPKMIVDKINALKAKFGLEECWTVTENGEIQSLC